MKGDVPDFYAHKIKLAIELDGGYQNDTTQKFYDTDREEVLIENGVNVLRFTNEEVIFNIHNVLSIIREKIILLKSLKEKK